jgi:hypothetical protein
MKANRSLTLAAGCLFAVVFVAACKDDSLPEHPPDEVAEPAPTVQKPVDHLAPTELLEGDEAAFGMKLPRAAHVEHAFPDTVYVTAYVPLAAMVDYIRTHVRDGSFTQSELSATFSHVKVPSRPGHEMTILLRENASARRCEVQLRDTTPPETPQYADEASRWRSQGLKPGGGILDPTHLE